MCEVSIAVCVCTDVIAVFIVFRQFKIIARRDTDACFPAVNCFFNICSKAFCFVSTFQPNIDAVQSSADVLRADCGVSVLDVAVQADK